MIQNYSYLIGPGYIFMDSLKDTRYWQRRLIRNDKTACLYKDNKGFYIRKVYDDGKSKRIY